MTRPQDAATEALADVLVERDDDDAAVRWVPRWVRLVCTQDKAEAIIKRLRKRGYVIRKARKSG